MDTNAAGSSKNGASAEKIAAVGAWREFPQLFDDAERAALALAESMSSTPADVDDETFAELRMHFRDEQIVELAGAIAMENYRARFNRVFGIESEHTYQP